MGVFALSIGAGVLPGQSAGVFGDCTPTQERGQKVFDGGSLNGRSLNGAGADGGSLNGRNINGAGADGGSLNGKKLNGEAPLGVRLTRTAVAADAPGAGAGGVALRGMVLAGSGITSVRASDGAILSGAALVGATFSTETAEGVPVDVRIDALELRPSRHGGAIHAYAISTAPRGGDAWRPACGVRDGAPVEAIPLAGRWDYREGVPGGGAKIHDGAQITFACEGYALAKCVQLGYEPWRDVGGVPLEAHHAACVRMIRADYCGDGRSWTEDGTIIHVHDGIGVQRDTAPWRVESEWDEGGARCLARRRIPGAEQPACALERPADACGVDPAWGPGATLLVSEAR